MKTKLQVIWSNCVKIDYAISPSCENSLICSLHTKNSFIVFCSMCLFINQKLVCSSIPYFKCSVLTTCSNKVTFINLKTIYGIINSIIKFFVYFGIAIWEYSYRFVFTCSVDTSCLRIIFNGVNLEKIYEVVIFL